MIEKHFIAPRNHAVTYYQNLEEVAWPHKPKNWTNDKIVQCGGNGGRGLQPLRAALRI